MRTNLYIGIFLFISQSLFAQKMTINNFEFSTKHHDPIQLADLDLLKIKFDSEKQQVEQFFIKAIPCFNSEEEIKFKVISKKGSYIVGSKFNLDCHKKFKLKKRSGCIDRVIIEIGFKDIEEPIHVIFLSREN